MTLRIIAASLAAAIALTGPANAQPLAKELFGAEHTASRQKAAPHGGYAKGCLAGGEQLAETGPTWNDVRRWETSGNLGNAMMITPTRTRVTTQ